MNEGAEKGDEEQVLDGALQGLREQADRIQSCINRRALSCLREHDRKTFGGQGGDER